MKKLKKIIILTLLIICISTIFSGCKKEDKLIEAPKNISTYNIDIDFDRNTKTLNAKQTLKYVNRSNDILKEVYFHLYPNSFSELVESPVSSNNYSTCYYNGKSFGKIEITRCKLNGVDISLNYASMTKEIASILIDIPFYPNESVEIYFEYNVILPNCNHRFGYGENTYNINNFYPIACVYEDGVWDTHTYNKIGDPFYSEVSNYVVNFTADSDLTFAFSGNINSKTKTNGKTCYEISNNAIRDFSIVGGENLKVHSTTYNDININYYYTDDENYQKSLSCAVDSIKTFSNLFCEYPYDNYNVVQADFCYGGMEYPNLVMISNSIKDYDDYLNCIIHETAHQWWYSLVGNNEYDEAWLDESLTEFSTAIFYDYNDGYNKLSSDIVKACYSNFEFYVTVYQDVLGEVDTSMNKNLDDFSSEVEYVYSVYVKGVMMYDSLKNIIKDKLITALSVYAKRFAYQNANQDDLINTIVQSSKIDLNSFFESWLNGKESVIY